MDGDQYRPMKYSKREDSTDRPSIPDAYRRRSPGNERRGGQRGGRVRSRSPAPIDRYQPDSDDYSRDRRPFREREDRRRGGSPRDIDRYVPGQDDPLPPPVRVNPLPNPLTLEVQVGFNWFAEWWRGEQMVKEDEERLKNGGRRQRRPSTKGDAKEEREKERAKIQPDYDRYKEEFQAKAAKTFVLAHKEQEWFKERYLPEYRDPFRERLMRFRQGALDSWENDLTSGVLDGFSLEGIYKADSNGAGGMVEREEGEAPTATEVLGTGDLVSSRVSESRDDALYQPTLLIKTLAPMVSRTKVEEFCKEHLGEQDGGFKWLSLSDPNVLKKCHRMGWIMLNPEPESEARVMERGDGRDDDGEVMDDVQEDKSALTGTSEKTLESINGKTLEDEKGGTFTCHVGVHTPVKELRKKALWDLFSAPERIERDLELAKRVAEKFDAEMGTHASSIEKIVQRVELLRQQELLEELVHGSNIPKKGQNGNAMGDADDMDREEGEEEEGLAEDEVDDETLLVQKKTLDLTVEYLRRVYNFCLFCVCECDSVHELVRKCAGGHLRRPRASLGTAAKQYARASAAGEAMPKKDDLSNQDEEMVASPVEEKKPEKSDNPRGGNKQEQQLRRAFSWVKTYEEKLLQVLEPENVDLKKIGGMPLEEGLDEELQKHVNQEDEAKFRCKVPECTKLFKSEPFWRKHVEKRHEEFFNNIKNNIKLINAYLLDPARVQPARPDMPINGQFSSLNSQMIGTPRGFNLANMGNMAGYAGNMAQAGFQNFQNFGTSGAQGMPMGGAGWPGGAAPMMDPSGMHQVGPMRRGRGGGMRTQQATPYDRRGPRYGRMNSRDFDTPAAAGMPMGMAMGMGMMGGRPGGKWGDGANPQAVGPREAVQGRQIKSYEDLDAVGGGGGGELNY